MPQKTTIEWCRSDAGEPGYTSNPIRARDIETGNVGWSCVKISTGCSRCYAEAINGRFGTKLDYNAAGAVRAELFVVDAELTALLKLQKTARVFLGDMTDIFQAGVTDDMLDRLFAVMALCPDLTFQVLTKRAERMARYFGATMRVDPPESSRPVDVPAAHRRVRAVAAEMAEHHRTTSRWVGHYNNLWPLPNVWLGVSVEDQARADERIPHLLTTPAALRFLSVEPLLGEVDLSLWLACYRNAAGEWNYGVDADYPHLTPIDWCIVGGESGPGARPCEINWIRSIVQQCQAAGTAVFCKQLGANVTGEWSEGGYGPHHIGKERFKLRNSKGGDMAEWPPDLRVRQFPTAHAGASS